MRKEKFFLVEIFILPPGVAVQPILHPSPFPRTSQAASSCEVTDDIDDKECLTYSRAANKVLSTTVPT